MTDPRFLPFKLPVEWEAIDAKWLFEETFAKGYPSEQPLSASQAFGVVPQEHLESMLKRQIMSATKGWENFKLVMPDDFVISLRSFEGGLEHSRYRGIISPAYSVIRPKDARVYPGFFRHYLKAYEFISRLQAVATGIRDGKTIRYDMFAELQLPVPPKSAQVRITRFLDRKTNSIDSLISKKQRLLELLEEKRLALITHTVTKGLDPHVKMKDSGVEWLGEVPEHWKVMKLKRIASLCSGHSINSTDIDTDGPYPVFGGNGIRGYSSRHTHEGDFVLIGRQGALCGCINYASGRFWASEHAVVVTPLTVVSTLWLGELLRTMNLNRYSQTAAQPGLSVEFISNLSVPFPPLSEQLAFEKYLKNVLYQLNSLMSKIQQSIEILKEYRSTLISATVTGQIDVREEV